MARWAGRESWVDAQRAAPVSLARDRLVAKCLGPRIAHHGARFLADDSVSVASAIGSERFDAGAVPSTFLLVPYAPPRTVGRTSAAGTQ